MNKKLKLKNNRGTTIIELVIYTFLISTLLIILTDVFSSIMDVQKESTAASEVTVDGRFMATKLYNQISRVSIVIVPANLNEISSSLSFTVDGVTYTYFLSAGDLYINDGTGPEKLNSYATEVVSFTAKRLGNAGGNHIIKINFTVNSTVIEASGTESENFEITAGLR